MPRRTSHLRECLNAEDFPVIAVTGYAQHVADQIGAHITSRFVALGADSTESLSANPISGKRVDKRWIVTLALRALAQEDKFHRSTSSRQCGAIFCNEQTVLTPPARCFVRHWPRAPGRH